MPHLFLNLRRLGSTRVLALAGILLLLPAREPSAAPAAQSTTGLHYVYGIVNTSCGAWTKQRGEKETTNPYEWWLTGFVTGASRGGALQKTDSEGIGAWMDKYCAEHPLDEIVTAANKLAAELTPRRGRGR